MKVNAATTTATSVKKEKMAALIRHGSIANAFKSTSDAVLAAIQCTTGARYRRDIVRHKSKKTAASQVKRRINDTAVSLAARGFLRPQKGYDPPAKMLERIDRICESQAISASNDVKLEDPILRFKLFVACEKEFQHSIPNSLLHTIESVEDLKKYYLTSIDSATPYEALHRIELPKNLYVQQDYHRFHPDTDTMFNGKSAFPKSSTLVTGLKYKKKYPGHMQENPWLEEQLKI